MTLRKAFEHFLDRASFARRTRESYTDDFAPLLTPYGQADVSVLTTEIIQAYLARQEALAPNHLQSAVGRVTQLSELSPGSRVSD